MQLAHSATAASAYQLVTALQRRMVEAQEWLAGGERFSETTWLRNDGRHGGGNRRGIADSATFDRASVNVSQVHYDDEPAKRLASATALSTIIHPRHPHAPSVHVHVSWTEMRDARGYWRIMADRALLASWRARVPAPIDELVDALLAALPPGDAAVEVADGTKRRLAAAVRAFYRAHPAAIELQARGDVVPPTVANHRSPP